MKDSGRLPTGLANSCRVVVDERLCNSVASIIRSISVPRDEENISLSDWSPELVGNLYLAVVAICHQTSPRGLPPLAGSVGGHVLRGWDYLLTKFAASALTEHELVSPEAWSRMPADTLRSVFHDGAAGNRLTDIEGRTLLLRDLGSKMIAKGWSYADKMYAASGHLISGPTSLLELLAEFRAYDDPVKKKSLFFLALMRNSGLWTYRDTDMLGPPVDYHEVRGHLRMGTVRIVDTTLLAKVRKDVAVTLLEDIAIRQAVFDAIMLISRKSGVGDPSRLHYFFWNVFRSICRREQPQCFSVVDGALLPPRYRLSLISRPELKCPFSAVCVSAGTINPVLEHVFESDYY